MARLDKGLTSNDTITLVVFWRAISVSGEVKTNNDNTGSRRILQKGASTDFVHFRTRRSFGAGAWISVQGGGLLAKNAWLFVPKNTAIVL